MGVLEGGDAFVTTGAHRSITDDEVVHDGGGDDGHRAGGSRMPAAVGSEGTHDAVGGGEAEGAAPGEDDGLNLLDLHPRAEKIGLSGPRSGTAHLNGGTVRLGKDDDGTAGHRLPVRPMPNPNPGNRSERLVRHRLSPYRRGSRGPNPHTISYVMVPALSAHSPAVTSSSP